MLRCWLVKQLTLSTGMLAFSFPVHANFWVISDVVNYRNVYAGYWCRRSSVMFMSWRLCHSGKIVYNFWQKVWESEQCIIILLNYLMFSFFAGNQLKCRYGCRQDSVPAYHVHDTVAFLSCETIHSIGPILLLYKYAIQIDIQIAIQIDVIYFTLLWLPNSLNLNPVDYKIWGSHAG